MSRIDEVTLLGRGLGEKTVGVTLEFAGTVLGDHDLRDRGRRLEDAGSKRWRAFEKDVRSLAQKRTRSHGSDSRSHRSSGNGSAKSSRSESSRTAAR
jgi:hypothetical protein